MVVLVVTVVRNGSQYWLGCWVNAVTNLCGSGVRGYRFPRSGVNGSNGGYWVVVGGGVVCGVWCVGVWGRGMVSGCGGSNDPTLAWE